MEAVGRDLECEQVGACFNIPLPDSPFIAALIALGLQPSAAQRVRAELPKIIALDPFPAPPQQEPAPEKKSGWQSTVMMRTWQIDSDLIGLNSKWMECSLQAGRNIIPEAEMSLFLNPQVPIEALFTKIKTLGEGAFGSTGLWQANDGKLYAIKELEPRLGNGSSDFQIGLALDHPHIVQIHNFVQKWANPEEMRRYLIMEYIDGETLKAQELLLIDRVRITREMLASALYMFQRGVLPLDLHSENAMVTRDGRWKWIDLGIYQPLSCAGRLTLSSYFQQLARLVRRTLRPSSANEELTQYFPPLREAVEMFSSLPQYEQAMSPELLPLLEKYCQMLLNWLDLYHECLTGNACLLNPSPLP